MVNTLTLAHGEDPDGIISHAFLESHEHIFARYDRIGEAFEEAAGSDAEVILIADLNVNPRLLSKESILEKLVKGRKVEWYDHHTGTLANKAKLESLGVAVHYEPDNCASLIIAKHLSFTGYHLRLAEIAQTSDYKSTTEDCEGIPPAEKLEKIISLANENMNDGLLLELVYGLRKGLVFNKKWELLPSWKYYLGKFKEREKKDYGEINDTISVIKVNQYNVLFCYASPLIAKQAVNDFRDQYKEHADIFICLSRAPLRNHLVLKTENSSFPVILFAQNLGGGGRQTGAGFTLDYDITPENYEAVKGMLVEELRKYS